MIVDRQTARRLVRQTPYVARLLRLHDEPSIATRYFSPPFGYSVGEPKGDGVFSNCCGTAVYVTAAEEGLKRYWTPEKAGGARDEFMAFPDSPTRPGFVHPAFMKAFLEDDGAFALITGKPVPGDLVTFYANGMLQHSAVFLDVVGGSSVLFYQKETGRDFMFGSVEECQDAISRNQHSACDFSIWRRT